MVSDSGRSSACTNFGMLFRFCRFSPFAEEGFTCLDHSMMSKKKAVTMFKSEELECCINILSARRLVVPKPAPVSSTAQTIWLLTQAQIDMGTVAQQQQNRKVDIHFIQDPDSVLRTDGCYYTRPRLSPNFAPWLRPFQSN